MSINTLHKGDDDDNNNNIVLSEYVEWEIERYVLGLKRTRTFITFYIQAFTG